MDVYQRNYIFLCKINVCSGSFARFIPQIFNYSRLRMETWEQCVKSAQNRALMLILNKFHIVDFEQLNAEWAVSVPLPTNDGSTTNIFPGSIRRFHKSYFAYHFLRASSVLSNSILGYIYIYIYISSISFFWELQYLRYHIWNIFQYIIIAQLRLWDVQFLLVFRCSLVCLSNPLFSKKGYFSDLQK